VSERHEGSESRRAIGTPGDRDGVVLFGPSPIPQWLGVTLSALACALGIFLAVELPFHVGKLLMVVIPATVLYAVVRPTKLLFCGDTLEVKWLWFASTVRYVDLAGFAVGERQIELRLRDGRQRTIDLLHEQELVAGLLTKVTGLVPDGHQGELVSVERNLGALLEQADAIARADEASTVEPFHVAYALATGEERAFLEGCGLNVALFDRITGDAYRGGERLPLSEELETILRAADIWCAQRGGGTVGPREVLLEIFRSGTFVVSQLARAGLTPMRYLDRLAHDLSPEQSDARAEGTLEAAALLEDVRGERAMVVLHDDPYSNIPTIAKVLEKTLVLSYAEARASAERMFSRGRETFGPYPKEQAARRAIDLMREARKMGSPLNVKLADA
jgi:hypothetical protein